MDNEILIYANWPLGNKKTRSQERVLTMSRLYYVISNLGSVPNLDSPKAVATELGTINGWYYLLLRHL